jgi:hypothetical protein
MECRFNEVLELRKGDIVKLIRGMHGSPLGVTMLENQTTSKIHRSHIGGIIPAADPPITFAEPITG